MTREEALRKAIELANLEMVPKKQNGYPVDGWRPPTREQQFAEIQYYAEFLLAQDSDE